MLYNIKKSYSWYHAMTSGSQANFSVCLILLISSTSSLVSSVSTSIFVFILSAVTDFGIIAENVNKQKLVN